MNPPFKKIAIIGSGAVGTYFGARMALAGADVGFLMRGDLAAVRSRGSIILRTKEGVSELRPVSAFSTPGEIGPVDLAVVALKTTSSGDARALIEPVLGPQTAILTLQNGIGADEFLAGQFGAGRVMGGLVFMAITRIGPGDIRCFNRGQVSIGELKGPSTGRTAALAELLTASGFKVVLVDNILEARWTKLVWNIPFNGLSIAEGGITTDKICGDARIAGEARDLMLEIQRAARGQGLVITDEHVRKQMEITPPMGAYQPSSLVDYLAGREVEVEAIWGEPLRRAEAAGIQMPRLRSLYGRLLACCPRRA